MSFDLYAPNKPPADLLREKAAHLRQAADHSDIEAGLARENAENFASGAASARALALQYESAASAIEAAS